MIKINEVASKRLSELKETFYECKDIILRGYQMEDLDRLYALTQEPEIMRFLPDWNVHKEQRRIWMQDYEIPENEQFLQAIMKDGHVGGLNLRLGIILRETNGFIGWCCSGIKNELEPPNREIMYAISQDYQNKGYTTQAVKGIVSYLFQHTDLAELNAIALTHNIGSNKVIQKSEFDLIRTIDIEGQPYNHYKIHKDRYDTQQG